MMQLPPGTETDNMLNRMTSSLLYRIDERCADLTVVFDRGSKKDLQTFFPILIDSIFGPQGSCSWGLRTIVSDNSINEFNVLLNFLKPMGPLFKLIYNLLQDQSIKYDFSLAYLPMKVRKMLDSPNVHPFYSEVLQYNTQNKQIVSLLLNPFDYYMFHFAYHLINPCHQRMSRDDLWNTVYYNLCAEYLLHFFPSGIDYQILPIINYYHGKNPLQMMQAYHRSKHSPLLKSNIFADAPLGIDVTMIHQMIEKHPRNEIWRSETIMMAFLDLWLSNDQICCHYNNFNNMTAHHVDLPSADYIRIIRVVVKHMHAFASTAVHDHSPLGELKKITLPMMQTRMYIFLRNLVYRWPLDESFRLVLELWLSFIQPWRYSHDLYIQRGGIYKNSLTNIQSGKEDNRCADEDYLPFIAENLLVYVIIFQQLLPRFTRVDLSSPKSAQMLFRLTKVFNQANLIPMLRKIEAVVENKNYSPNHTVNAAVGQNLPPLSPTSKWSTNNDGLIYDSTHIEQPNRPLVQFTEQEYAGLSNKYSSLVRQKIFDLEGANFLYKPLFSTNAAAEVYELLHMIKSAEIKAMYLLQQKRREEAAAYSFFSLFTNSTDIDKISLLDRQKAPTFLRCSADNLVDMFQIQDFNNFDVTPDMSELCNNTSSHKDDTFPNILAPDRVRQRVKSLKYDGDPDLMRICSFEIAFMVRALYDLSKKINESYGDTIKSLYYNNGFLGRFARNFIQEPTIIYTYDKTHGCSKRVPSILEPRISLRKFAKRNLVMSVVSGSVLTYWLDYGAFSFVLLYLLLHIALYFVKAVFTRKRFSPIGPGINDTLDD